MEQDEKLKADAHEWRLAQMQEVLDNLRVSVRSDSTAHEGQERTEKMNKTISEQALIKRINRRIGGYDAKTCTAWGDRLRKNSSDRSYSDLGRFYTVDMNSNGVSSAHINLEQYGHEVGALTEREALKG